MHNIVIGHQRRMPTRPGTEIYPGSSVAEPVFRKGGASCYSSRRPCIAGPNRVGFRSPAVSENYMLRIQRPCLHPTEECQGLSCRENR